MYALTRVAFFSSLGSPPFLVEYPTSFSSLTSSRFSGVTAVIDCFPQPFFRICQSPHASWNPSSICTRSSGSMALACTKDGEASPTLSFVRPPPLAPLAPPPLPGGGALLSWEAL